MTGRPWTDDEIGFLQDNWDRPIKWQAEELDRSTKSIDSARVKIRRGWTGNQNPGWTEDEDEILRSARSDESAESLADRLPSRGVPAIRKRRHQLGIKVLGNRPTEIGGRPLVAKTCMTCGLLLAGSWFHSVKTKNRIAWSPHCKKCSSDKSVDWQRKNAKRTNETIRRHEDRLQQITVQQATRSGEPYTEADYEVLADQSLTDFQKAIRLKRSWKAVKSARHAAGLKSKPDGLGDPTRDVWVIDNPNALEIAS